MTRSPTSGLAAEVREVGLLAAVDEKSRSLLS
jgi:hypothetical protein